ncbi:YheC/YheD family protein [Salipaludibacillus keqinensis]|nr:YheC/YheD family protein [Salipaludibacillus keqinensis]
MEDKEYFGVLISSRAWRAAIAKNEPHYRLKKLAEANQEVDFNMYLFPVKNVDLKAQTIKALYFDPSDKTWKIAVFPYPDILYRRGGASRKFKDHYKKFLKQCEERNTVILNPSPIENWQVYDYFTTKESLTSNLVETNLYEGKEDLFYMIKKYGSVNLMEAAGSNKKRVTRADANRGNRYTFYYFNPNKQKVESRNNLKLRELNRAIMDFYKGSEFMVQEGIDFLKLNGRQVDLRAELQKTSDGTINISGISARLSRDKSPITIQTDAFPIDELFELLKISPAGKQSLMQQINEFLISVYKNTEEQYGEFAELGIDFALTKDLQIKFIKCKSQSAKGSFAKAFGKEKLHPVMVNILSYSQEMLKGKREGENLTFWQKFSSWFKGNSNNLT